MNETLREELNLPKIGGELIAHFERRYTLRRLRLGNETEPYFIRDFPYDTILRGYYERKTELRQTIESFKKFHRSNIINIFEYRLRKNKKYQGFDDRYKRIEQYLIQAKNWSFNEELISELLKIIYEIKLLQIIYEIISNKASYNRRKQGDLKSIKHDLDILNRSISEYEEGIRRINIRLRGIRKVFGNKTDEVLKMIEKKSYNYSLSSFEFIKHRYGIINEVFKSEPQKLYRANWYFYVNFAGPDRRYLDGSIVVSSEDFAKLIDDLETALEKMKSLKEVEFSGLFTKLARDSKPKLEVFSKDKEIGLKFWVHSQNHDYYQIIDISNLEKIINELKQVEEKGRKLTSTLEALCF